MAIKDPSDIKLNERYDVEALIGSPPGWTLRWGLTAMLAVLALLFWVAYLVRYPDVVEARAVLTTENPPIRLVAGASAKIEKLTVSNGSRVQLGALLGVLESPARLEDVVFLDSVLQKMMKEEVNGNLDLKLPEALKLGALQARYAEFSQRLKDLKYFLSQDINYLKISNLRKQMDEIQRLNNSLARQEKILQEEVLLAMKNMQRDSILLANKSGVQLEFERSQSDWLAKRRELEALRSGTAGNNLRIREMQAQILDLQQVQSDGESQKLLDFRTEAQRLQGEIGIWKQTYLLLAPVGGEVALTKTWSEQQFVEAGTEVLTIVPQEGAGEILAKALLPSARSGKVIIGMPVIIRLDGYPYQEFGVLNGAVRRIAVVPGEQGYELEISVPKDLKTSYGNLVPFRQEMQGTARIVTEKRSLLNRVLERILAGFQDN
ncbi:MAG: HlyD family efflux transporter periplasmic adaptor subunit [Saprospiraceae bacterium]|nr:HlyD family efflux transporter periplasmic adaptor subunit [Saprospiraceae bacterium]MCF8248327.1 HlyD family efflux transporter periplasmic adaptor subunit [Saprospiraceae bacterium]MCF8280234.1 HlyD family efflux transporter periplasmic adaptor subunit [Bacteroidales bacterium]MCF8309855.1 HlyD family efflux transporter periplasmic adaptor subunit [Saprospiraceae bacterium]MCF8438814.1 HlyD family efflux transporter periplasmic adaptor subunit [Saprospiraceae bacterium]